MLIQALGLLCGLGAATFSAVAATKRSVVGLCFVGAFALTALWTGLERVPNLSFVGTTVVIVGTLQLARSGFFPLTATSAGILSAVWISVLRTQGLGLILAVILAVGVPAVSMLLALRAPMFAPVPMFEEALLLLVSLAIVTAASPVIQSGWETARALNVPYAGGENTVSASGVFWVGTAAIGLGGCYGFWWRRR
jgi:hypothetical protein